MLVLTHGSPANDAQRGVFAVLHHLGLGGEGRRGVVVLGDGFERFGPIAGVICTPEGMAVLSVHAVSGADGYLFAPLRGTWTIGGRPATIDGIQANPVQAVDAALKKVVAAVRRGGLDPGYVQSILLVDGPVTGVAQPETERGTGAVVAAAQRDAIVEAIDIATTNRQPGLPSTWTTADLTGMLEVLGFDCSDLDSQLLTGEGFPYSPYVLRPTSADDIPFSRPETTAGATRALRSHSPRSGAVPVAGVLDDPLLPPVDSPTGPVPAVPPPLSAAPPARPAEPDGPAALLNAPGEEPEPRRSPWRWLVPLVVLALVITGVALGWNTLFGGAGGGDAASSSAASAPADGSGAAGPQSSGGYGFTKQAQDTQKNCAAHAYGDIKAFLAGHPCVGMKRGLFLTQVDGKQAVVSLVEVTMPDADSAASLKATTDKNGTGNVNDLLREGAGPTGMPAKDSLADGEYASSVDGKVVRIAQAAYVDGSASSARVDAAADAALTLKLS